MVILCRLVNLHRFCGFCRTGQKLSTYRRALFYVPANQERKLRKIPQLVADSIVLDCEDGVAEVSKTEARNNVIAFLQSDMPSSVNCELAWRVNSLQSGLLEEDLKAVAEAKVELETILLPKVNSINDLKQFSILFRNYFQYVKKSIMLLIYVESAQSLLNMAKIVNAAFNLSTFCPLYLDGVVFGSDDYCADIGIQRSEDTVELIYARQRFVSICKAFKLQAVDMVYNDYKNLNGLAAHCHEAKGLGFTGKQIIHPDQIKIVQDSFMPTVEELERAKEIVEEFEKQKTSGIGAFTFHTSMIDMPLVLQAMRTWNHLTFQNGILHNKLVYNVDAMQFLYLLSFHRLRIKSKQEKDCVLSIFKNVIVLGL
ncbi:Citrate lyase subunit beta-like protein, mitochondrial, partial [Trichinella pseudospiralis]